MIDVGSAVGYLLLDTSGFQTGLQKASSQLDTFADKSKSFGTRMNALGDFSRSAGSKLTTGLTLPLAAAGTVAIKTSTDFKSAFNQLVSSTGAGTEEMKKFENVMKEVYKNNYGESFEDIANSISEVRKQMGDLNEKELQEVTESAIAFRDTFGYEVPESIRSASTLMKNFGITSKEAFDYMTYGIQNGLDFSGEFLDTINEYSVQFGKLGFSAEDMFAILKKGTEEGAFNLDKVGDAIKEFSIRAIDGSKTTRAAYELLGLDADEMEMKFLQGGEVAKKAFSEIVDAIANMDDMMIQSTAGVNLFGTMWEDLGPDVVLQLNEITEGLGGVTGSMDDLKKVKYDDLGSMIAGLGRSLELLALSFGNILMPYILDFIEFLQGVVDEISKMDEETQQIVLIVAGVAAAIGPLLTAFGSLISIISSIGPVVTALSGPLGIVLAAVAAFALAWITDFGGVRDTTSEILSGIVEIAGQFLELLVGLWEENFLGIQTIIEIVMDAVMQVVQNALTIIEGAVKIFSGVLTGDWQAVWDGILMILKSIWDLMVTLVKDGLALFISIILNAILGIAQAFTDLWNAGYNAMKSVFDNYIWPFITASPEEMFRMIVNGASRLYEAGRNIFTSLWDGLKSVWEDITSWVMDSLSWLFGRMDEAESAARSVSSYESSGRGGSPGNPDGYYASGLSYVPREMNVRVHEGERILTKEENKNYSGYPRAARMYITNNFTEPVDSGTAKKVSKEIGQETEKELRGKGVVLV